MRSGPIKLVVAWLMLPGTLHADLLAETTHSTIPLPTPLWGWLGREPAPAMFLSSFDDTLFRLFTSNVDTDARSRNRFEQPLLTLTRAKRTPMAGGLAITEHIGVSGRFGGRRHVSNSSSPLEGVGAAQQLVHRYSFGVNVRATQHWSLQLQWERHGPVGVAVGADPSKSDWDPWKERNVFGAGVRLGF